MKDIKQDKVSSKAKHQKRAGTHVYARAFIVQSTAYTLIIIGKRVAL